MDSCRSLATLETTALAPVRITLGKPRMRLDYALAGEIRKLAPSGRLFRIEDPVEFRAAYRERLDRLGVDAVRAQLRAIVAAHGGRGAVLLCFEDVRVPGEWCHRRIFAEWWAERTGQVVAELRDPSPLPGTQLRFREADGTG